MHDEEDGADGFGALVGGAGVLAALTERAPRSLAAIGRFWRVPMASTLLTPRMKELVLLAMHATTTALDVEAIRRHVRRAIDAGASEADVLDVLLSIVGVANHALYRAVPVLLEELDAAGVAEPEPPALGEAFEEVRRRFVEVRGFWNADRDVIARLMPDYFAALTALSVEPWISGSLTPRERELVYISIDTTVTHMYEPGLRLHIRNAVAHGATRDEILEVFQLAALLGVEGYATGASELFAEAAEDGPATTP